MILYNWDQIPKVIVNILFYILNWTFLTSVLIVLNVLIVLIVPEVDSPSSLSSSPPSPQTQALAQRKLEEPKHKHLYELFSFYFPTST